MRYTFLLLIAPTLLATGCSIYMAKAGEDLSHLRTRQDARAEFGPPTAEGVDDGLPFEEFQSRRKISESWRAGTHSMALGMTMFLYELYLFPRELYYVTRCGFVGQTVRLKYNHDGTVRSSSVDGRWNGVVNRPAVERPIPESITTPADVLTPTVHRLLDDKQMTEKVK